MTDIKLLRSSDESFMDYHIRLFEHKDEYGIDKFKIAELLNNEYGSSYDESKWRKDYAQYLKWKDYIINSNLDKDIVSKYEEIRINSEKEKIRNRDQKREYKKLISNSARFEKIRNDVLIAISELEKKKPLSPSLPNEIASTKEGLVLFSDWHYGMEIDNYCNKFNEQVFNERVTKLISKTIEYGKKHEISTLHVANLGDLIAGLIHISTRVQANEDAIGQIQYVSETLAEALDLFSNEFTNVKFYNITGNHGRIVSNKNDVGIKENFEYLIPWYLEARLRKHTNIEIINEQDGFILTTILNSNIAFTHGHYDKPDQAVTKIPQMTGIIPDFIFSGHIHHHFEKEYGKTICIVNSSLIGNDDYAMQGRFGSNPAQKFLVFDEKESLECTYNIKLN